MFGLAAALLKDVNKKTKILAISEIHLEALFRGPSATVYKPPTTRTLYFGAYFYRKLANGK